MKIISTPGAPEPAGHYAQAIEHNGLVFISGILPVKPATREKVTGPVEEQVQQVLSNLDAILEAAGSSREKVLKVNIYVADIALWDRVNREYAHFFGDHKPARAVIPSGELHHGLLLELEAVAAK